MKTKNLISVVLRLIASVIMLQTLYFKFTGQPESIYIFSQVGIEPWGRIATGVAELVATVLLWTPAAVFAGALLTAGIMSGAIATHLFILGIVVDNDNGLLFGYAIVVWLCAVVLLVMYRHQWKPRKRNTNK
ncbi:MAG: DoxX family protein [Cyclobacteriaceae bacterium]|nr:DoxX family protein [Cyclobacteriaceae bacterium]